MTRSFYVDQPGFCAAENFLPNRKIIQPPALRQGDKIGILAPASSFSRDAFEAGCARLKQMGYEPVYQPGIFERDLYFAGSVARRRQELEDLLRRQDIAALICVRGGYGSNYLLESFHVELFARYPKIFLGCSDITSLLTAIMDRTGLVTFHGPMLAKDIADGTFDELSWKNCFSGTGAWSLTSSEMEVLQPGHAKGRLYGGCLSMLVESMGTPYQIQTEDTILFIEDVAEKPFRIDRMLMQLHLGGMLNRVRGFVFGEMLDCLPPQGESYTLQQVIARVLSPYKVPIVYGLKSGHVTGGNITLPLGVQAELTADQGVELKILEPATQIR
jgi:muramoyltetrapeptide carboxypeptidase